MPPSPVAIATPMRSRSGPPPLSPASASAWAAAATAYCVNRSVRRISLRSIYFAGSNPLISLDLRLVGRRIEAGDAADAAPTVDETIPRGRHIEAQGRHGPEAGDDDAARHRGAAAARSRKIDSAPVIERGSDTLRSFTSAMRFTRPLTTWPAPISTNVEAPRSAMYLTERSHSTRFERCRTSASGIADADGCGIALTFATMGTTGSWK